MCGINGMYQLKGKRFHARTMAAVVHSMNEQIVYRGPDHEGSYSDETCAVGMRRLSIIDLAEGNQPIWNNENTKTIVFNGEIYNYQELRASLIKEGCKFRTNSDTEVVLQGFEKYGVNFFQKMTGMFALAIYDITEKKLILARDRAGEKPLYYTEQNDIFLFASEVKSILTTGLTDRKINKKALCQYFQLSYIPAPLSIFDGIYKLLPGHYLEIGKEGILACRQYWDVKYDKKDLIMDYGQCKELLRQAVFRSVERCMKADVPVGTFLSGGIDSGTIAGVMAEISDKPIKTFTIGFEDKRYDESNLAALAASRYRTEHHSKKISFDDALSEIPNVVESMDEPFADSSSIATYILSKYAGQYVKVVLTGDAGDELFAGYSRYKIGYYSELYKKIPAPIQKYVVDNLVSRLPNTSKLSRKARKVIDNGKLNIFAQRKNLMCLAFKENELINLLEDEVYIQESLKLIDEYYYQYSEQADEIACALYTDFKLDLEGDMLTKVDRMSMLCSLETRVPFLSEEIIELAARIPSTYKTTKSTLKKILKESFMDIVPQEILKAPKSGFEVPISAWIKTAFKEDLLCSFSKEKIEKQGIFSYSYLKSIVDEHMNGKRNRGNEIWAVYMFEKWYERWIGV